MGTVLITGGAGFIGKHIVKEFLSNDTRVKCLVRSKANIEKLSDFEIDMLEGDITNISSLERACIDVDCVIHNAAFVKDWGNYETFYNINVEGTLNVLKACLANGIKKVIMTGTNSVYGEEDSKEIKTEESPEISHYFYFLDRIFPSKMNYYRDTKKIAKDKAIEFAKKHGINLTILEPVWVYGEGETHTCFYEYLKTSKEGCPVFPGIKSNKFHVVYVKDLAKAYYQAYNQDNKGVRSFIICNENIHYMDKIFEIFCIEAGLKKPCNLPKYIVYPVGFLLELLFTILKFKNPPLLTRARVNMFYDNIEYSGEKAKEELLFVPMTPIEVGISNTVKWYKEKNLI